MGTPDFAVPSLETLMENKEQVIGVVTQPDRPKGRGQKLTSSPVKEKALAYGLPVYQPENINTSEFGEFLRELAPDLIVVVAFGQLLLTEILTLPKLGCINVHASLLPKYRGAAPIHRAIIDGEQETGITIMYMAEKLDAGDMLLQERVKIEQEDNLGSLHDKLARLGGNLLQKTVEGFRKRDLSRMPQNHSQATYAAKIEKKDVEIDWSKSALQIHNLVRGTNPWPGAYTYFETKLWKIWQVDIKEMEGKTGLPGKIISTMDGKSILVATGEGNLALEEIQPENSKRMRVVDYLKGHRLETNTVLGRR